MVKRAAMTEVDVMLKKQKHKQRRAAMVGVQSHETAYPFQLVSRLVITFKDSYL